MSISVPVINAGLARTPDAELHLAAFGIAFALSLVLESPVFALQQSVVAWYPGSGPFRHLVLFSLGLGMLMGMVVAAVAFSPLATILFRDLMGAPSPLLAPAVEALRVSALFPPLVAVRLSFQGVLIGKRNSSPIAWGTFLRLLFLGLFVFQVCPLLPLGPPAAANLALVVAIFLEMIYVAYAARRTPDRVGVPSPAQAAGRSLGGRVRFLLPLAGTMLLGTLTNPVIHAFISRTAEPATSLAVYAVVSSLVWFLASPTLRYSAVTIALGTRPDSRRALGRFLWRVVGGLSALVFALTLTPALPWLLGHVIGLTPELAARARLPLVLLSLQPLVAGFIAFNQGILTRSARTRMVGIGAMSRIVAIGVGGGLGILLHVRGGLLGGVLLGAAFAAELVSLVFLRRRTGSTTAGPALPGS
jgi:hypothetical protein